MNTLFQIKVQLMGVKKPPVWRRLLIPTRITFYELHLIIQEAMPWLDYHLYEFTMPNVIATDPTYVDEDCTPQEDTVYVDARMTMIFLPLMVFGKLDYYYDFGDGWHLKITLEDVVENSESLLPQLVAWKGTAPPEDVGGTGGYEYFKEVMADPSHEEYEELKEWALGQFYGDPDMDEINRTFGDFFEDPGFVHTINPYQLVAEHEDLNNE